MTAQHLAVRKVGASPFRPSLNMVGIHFFKAPDPARIRAVTNRAQWAVGFACRFRGGSLPVIGQPKAYPFEPGLPRCGIQGLRRAEGSCNVPSCLHAGHQLAPCRARSSRRCFPTTTRARNILPRNAGPKASPVRFATPEAVEDRNGRRGRPQRGAAGDETPGTRALFHPG